MANPRDVVVSRLLQYANFNGIKDFVFGQDEVFDRNGKKVCSVCILSKDGAYIAGMDFVMEK